jgi:O-antigen ligase
MALLLALTIALMALILAPGYSFYFDITPKLVVLLAGTALILVFASLALPKRLPSRDRQGAVFQAFSLLLILNLLSLAFSTALSARPELSLFGTNWRRYGSVIQGTILLFAWLVAVACAGRPERVKTVLRGIVVAGAVSAAYGIAQYFGWDPLLPAAAYHVGEGDYIIVRPPGTLGYASYFATWLLLVVFLGRALAAMEDSIAWRRFAIGVTPLAGFAMLLTGTRAAILGLAVGGVVWIAIKKARATRRIAAWAAVAVIAGVVFYYSPSGHQMRSRARWFAEDPWGGVRGNLWRDSLGMASNRLAAGYGPEVFTGEFPQYESVELARAYPDFSHESPHNIFLDALVAQGIPGFLALLGLCALPFIAGRRTELTAALAAALVSQQFTAFTIPTAVTFFTVLALVVALETPAVQVLRRLPLVSVAAALAMGLLFLAVRFTLADHALASTKQALDGGNLRAAAADYEKYQRLRLPGGTADLWYSRSMLGIVLKLTNPPERLSAMVQSGAAAQRATETAEDPFNAWYNLGVVYGLQNDAAGAERSLRAAIAAHPTWFKPHWMLAQVLRLEGRRDEARREALLAGELDAGKDPEVARTVEEFGVHPQPLQR